MFKHIIQFTAVVSACSCLLAAEDPLQRPALHITTNLNGTLTFLLDNTVFDDVLGTNPHASGWIISSFHAEVNRPGFRIEPPTGFPGLPSPFTGFPVLNEDLSGYGLTFKNPIDTELSATWSFLYPAGRDPRLWLTTFKFDTPDGRLHDFNYIVNWVEEPGGGRKQVSDGGNAAGLMSITILGLLGIHRLKKRNTASCKT